MPRWFLKYILLGAWFCCCVSVSAKDLTITLGRAYSPLNNLRISSETALFDDNSSSLPPSKQIVIERCRRGLCVSLNGRVLSIVKPLTLISSSPIGIEFSDVGVARTYTGKIKLWPSNPGISMMNIVSERDYLASVIGGEMGITTHVEALKAQAVIARHNLHQYLERGEKLDDTTSFQAYRGASYITTQTAAALDDTWNFKLANDPGLLHFSAHCGGSIADIGYFTGKLTSSESELPSCTHNIRAGVFDTWKVHRITRADSVRIFGVEGLPCIIAWGAGGRPQQIRWPNGYTIAAYSFWLKLGRARGWGAVPGTMFRLACDLDGSLLISSRGAGHGIGLCQTGANLMARSGSTFEQILKHYYPNLQVVHQ